MMSARLLKTSEVESQILEPCRAVPAFGAFYDDLITEIETILEDINWGHTPDLPAIAAFLANQEKDSIFFQTLPIKGIDGAFAVSHELFHAILVRRGYPSWKTPLLNSSGLPRKLLSTYMNQLQHLLIYPAQRDYGFDVLTWWQGNDLARVRRSLAERPEGATPIIPREFQARLLVAANWSQLELEYYVLTGNRLPDWFYNESRHFGEIDRLSAEIVSNVKRIGWDTPEQHLMLVRWLIDITR